MIYKNLLSRYLLFQFIIISFLYSQDPKDVINKIDEDTYQIGNLTFDSKNKTITIPAQVNMTEGLIEVLLSTHDGKVHESLLATSCRPTYLQLALITLGYVPVNNPDTSIIKTEADSFEICIEWSNEKGEHKFAAEELIRNLRTGTTMKNTSWDFTGSTFYPDGNLTAESEGTLISTYTMNSILENGLSTKYDDTLYYVNEKMVPQKGTEVILIIKPYISTQGDD